MDVPEELRDVFERIDSNKATYVADLKEAIAIRSVSGDPNLRNEVRRMVDWTAARLTALGAEVKLQDLGKQRLPDGTFIPLPSIILASIGTDITKKTVCVYGHLDVQQALKEDGWETSPFSLTEKSGKLYGRGTTDNKGPILCWFHAIQAYQTLEVPLPVNIKFILESMEEAGSIGFDSVLLREKNKFLSNIDYVCVTSNYWVGTEKPCLTYGTRGLSYFMVEVQCAKNDMHSGVHGGSMYEAMPDLIYILDSLVDKSGNILIPDINKDVPYVLPDEVEAYKQINFALEDYRTNAGLFKLTQDTKHDLLMRRWRYPSLSIHGIEGAFSAPGVKTVIPGKVVGKFSIRTVANQDPDIIEKCVINYLKWKWRQRRSPNSMKVYLTISGKPWISDTTHHNYKSAQRATKYVYKYDPDFTREGNTVPIISKLQDAIGKNILMLPIGANDDCAHAANEKIDVRHYIMGTKLLVGYLYELSEMTEQTEEQRTEAPV